MGESLHDDAVLLSFFAKAAELIGSCVSSGDVEIEANSFESHGNVFGNTEGAAKIEVAFGGYFYTFGGNAHGASDHLAGDLSAGSESAEEEIAGTSARAGSADTGVSFGLVNGASDIDRAGDGRAGLGTFGTDGDARRLGISAILILEGSLKGAKIHTNLHFHRFR